MQEQSQRSAPGFFKMAPTKKSGPEESVIMGVRKGALCGLAECYDYQESHETGVYYWGN
jgi:hypothetical protein